MKRIALALVPLVILAGLVALFAANLGRDPEYVPSVLIDKPAPDFALAAVPGTGKAGFSSADLRGHVSVVNVFASWCVPCRDEHPFLMELSETTDVALYGINQKDQPDQAVKFLDGLGDPYDRIGGDTNGRVSIDWGVYGVPETFVVNAEGVITYKFTGPLSQATFETALLPAIEAAKIKP